MSTMKTTRDVKGVGLSIPRPDGPEKVTGRVQYVADIKPRGLLHAKLLRSPHAHARIVRIDTSKAAAFPGVKAIVTADDLAESADRMVDLGEGETPLSFIRGNVLAKGKALYKGHAIAAVAATSQHIAEEAAQLIEVEYEA